MVVSQNDNAKGLYGWEAIEFIKQYFAQNLPSAELVFENADSGYWCIKYYYQGAYITLDSDRGSLHGSITIDNKEFPLWQFDRVVNSAMWSDDKSMLIVLKTVKRFFESKT